MLHGSWVSKGVAMSKQSAVSGHVDTKSLLLLLWRKSNLCKQ